MSVASTDLNWYQSLDWANAEVDSATVGGAIDTSTIVVPTSASLFNTMSDSKVDIVSSASGDTSQTVTVYGRNDAGSIISEALSLNGTTLVNGTLTYNRLEKITSSATMTGTLTVTAHTGGTTICTLVPGVKNIVRPFYNVSADVSGGSTRTYYEKCFIKNNNGTNSLLGAQVIEEEDPSGYISFWVVGSVNDSGTTANRQTAPSGSSFSTSAQNIASTDLASSSAQGVWFLLTLPAGTAATLTTFTPRVSGSTI
jgi:hypothetical protein